MKDASQANPLAILVELEQRIRSISEINELKFVVVNQTQSLVPYRQAILFSANGKPITFSGVASMEQGTPFVYWLKKHIAPVIKNTNQTIRLTPEALDSKYASEWGSWLPSFALLQPIMSPSGERLGTLLLARDNVWRDEDIELLNVLTGAYGHAWYAVRGPRKKLRWTRNKRVTKIIILIAVAIILTLPVPLTVLAPAEIVAVNPAIIRAPVEGVVESVLVQSNQSVKVGELLFKMDAASQRNDLAVAQKIFDSLQAQYSQVSRRALSDPKSKNYLAETAGRIKEQKTRIKYLKSLIKRMKVSAPIGGSVMIDDPLSWEGKPVNLGEKIMSLADQKLVEVEAWLSVSDAIDLSQGSSIRVYLNSDPLTPINAVLRTYSYEAQRRPHGAYAHRIRGSIETTNSLPRLGLRGTARMEGKTVLLVYWLFRRPISALRQFVGL